MNTRSNQRVLAAAIGERARAACTSVAQSWGISRPPDWHQTSPNRFASHFFLMNVSEVYRAVSGMDLSNEALDLDIVDKVYGPKSGR